MNTSTLRTKGWYRTFAAKYKNRYTGAIGSIPTQCPIRSVELAFVTHHQNGCWRRFAVKRVSFARWRDHSNWLPRRAQFAVWHFHLLSGATVAIYIPAISGGVRPHTLWKSVNFICVWEGSFATIPKSKRLPSQCSGRLDSDRPRRRYSKHVCLSAFSCESVVVCVLDQ